VNRLELAPYPFGHIECYRQEANILRYGMKKGAGLTNHCSGPEEARRLIGLAFWQAAEFKRYPHFLPLILNIRIFADH